MNETPKRLKPTPETFRELFLKSRNLCAYPGCDGLMMNQDGLFIGQLCHIEAAEPGGERFKSDMTNEERRAASNLMLMCYAHHRETNDVARYTATDLRMMKGAHERRYSRPDRAMHEKLARLNWRSLLLFRPSSAKRRTRRVAFDLWKPMAGSGMPASGRHDGKADMATADCFRP